MMFLHRHSDRWTPSTRMRDRRSDRQTPGTARVLDDTDWFAPQITTLHPTTLCAVPRFNQE